MELKNILFAGTVESELNVPDRLRRLMGVIKLQEMSDRDVSMVIGNFYKVYQPYMNCKHFGTWL